MLHPRRGFWKEAAKPPAFGADSGTFESVDAGANWAPFNEGVRADFQPDPNLVFGHDPHCVRFAGGNPDRLYQQNHCGLFQLDRPATRWQDIGTGMPKAVGYVGLPMVTHPHDADTAWIPPVDGTNVWPRVSPGGRPSVFRTRNAGKTRQRLATGMPKAQAWWTVKRQAMTTDAHSEVGVYFGTTQGQSWGSRDERQTWRRLVEHLPHIYAVEVA